MTTKPTFNRHDPANAHVDPGTPGTYVADPPETIAAARRTAAVIRAGATTTEPGCRVDGGIGVAAFAGRPADPGCGRAQCGRCYED